MRHATFQAAAPHHRHHRVVRAAAEATRARARARAARRRRALEARRSALPISGLIGISLFLFFVIKISQAQAQLNSTAN